jgi:hypothetical protein
MTNRQNAARTERLQRKTDAGFMAAQYPQVSTIVISMQYKQGGIKSVPRIVNFFPGSYASFRVDCLSRGCVDGGFDLTTLITSMIGERKKAAKGDLCCAGTVPSSNHSTIAYEVAIEYV